MINENKCYKHLGLNVIFECPQGNESRNMSSFGGCRENNPDAGVLLNEIDFRIKYQSFYCHIFQNVAVSHILSISNASTLNESEKKMMNHIICFHHMCSILYQLTSTKNDEFQGSQKIATLI